jgi:hypothetical protein
MAKPPKSDNVTQLRSGLSPEQTSHKILAGIRAVEQLSAQLDIAESSQAAIESDKLSAATKSYRGLVREADELGNALTAAESHRILPLVCAGLAEHDALIEANKLARGNRKAERGRVSQARLELHKPAMDDRQSKQSMLPITGDTIGLGWFSDETKAVVYTALLDLDGRGGLDTAQAELMTDLASANLQPIAFVLDAADALDEADAAESDPVVSSELAAMADQDASLPI